MPSLLQGSSFVVAVLLVAAVQIDALPLLRHNTKVVSTFPDSDYDVMQQRILSSLDSVTGRDFIFNWFPLLSANVTVCYPFVGIVDGDHCEVGLAAVERGWGHGPYVGETSLVQDRFWLSKQGPSTMGVFEYTTSSSYAHNGTTCVVQFNGVVMWRLSATNSSLLDMWLETPNSNRLADTYPCTL
jgi:hypothetical protein